MGQWDAKSFSEAVLARDKVCQHCGGTELLQAHHKEHRANGGSDDPSNGVALCAGCHADEHPDLPRDLFFIKAFGPTNGKGWPATYVAGLLHCHPRSVVRHARKAGIKREGSYWAFTEDDLAKLRSEIHQLTNSKSANFTIGDDDLWRKFRAGCILHGTNASQAIERFMFWQVQEWEKEAAGQPFQSLHIAIVDCAQDGEGEQPL